MEQVWCNGEWLAADGIRVSATDRGLFHGLGLFETLLAVDGQPVFADRHLARLEASCVRFGWNLPRDELETAMDEILRRNSLGLGRARLRITITAGSGALDDPRAGSDRLAIVSAMRAAEVPESIAATVSPWKPDEHSPLAGLKSTAYAAHLLALADARAAGFDEALLYNSAGHLCEAATANVFLVTGGILFTPGLETGCLPGVTRSLMLEIAAALRLPVRECLLIPRDLHSAHEVFVTSPVRGPVPLHRLDDRPLPVSETAAVLRDAWRGRVGLV